MEHVNWSKSVSTYKPQHNGCRMWAFDLRQCYRAVLRPLQGVVEYSPCPLDGVKCNCHPLSCLNHTAAMWKTKLIDGGQQDEENGRGLVEAHCTAVFSLNFSITWARVAPLLFKSVWAHVSCRSETRNMIIHDTVPTGNEHAGTEQPHTLAPEFYNSGSHLSYQTVRNIRQKLKKTPPVLHNWDIS